jgi:hypothetical protein
VAGDIEMRPCRDAVVGLEDDGDKSLQRKLIRGGKPHGAGADDCDPFSCLLQNFNTTLL